MNPRLQEFSERIQRAAAHAQPLRLRGGGSKDGYGQSLQGELLDTRAHAGIVSYEPSELVVTVRAGTPLGELEAVLAEQGQCLPFEPPHCLPATPATLVQAGVATCGGMLAAGLSGPSRASVGAVRDYVLGVTLLNGRGELLSFGGQVMKNVAGYDVSRLMTGALGTLGLVVELSLKVLAVAPAEATLRFKFRQSEALRQLHLWGAQPLPLNASCWMAGSPEDGASGPAGASESVDPMGTLTLRLRGAVAAVGSACSRLGGEQLTSGDAAAFWEARRNMRMPWPIPAAGFDLWRISVPQTAPVLDLPGQTLIEWHGAQRWLHSRTSDAAQVRAAAHAAGGSAALFISGDDSRRPFFDALAPPIERIHRGLKREFDPAGIFNRGRMFADW